MTKQDEAIMIVNMCPSQVVNFCFLRILKTGG